MLRQEALDRISTPADLEELVRITSPRTWLALIAALSLILVVALWATITTLASTVDGRGALTGGREGLLGAIVYVSPDDAGQIKDGLDVQLSLSAVNKQEAGVLLARVESIDDFPSSKRSMLTNLGNDAFVDALATAGDLVAVHLALERQGEHYRWTLAQGAEVSLKAGMICDARIIVSEVHPISLLKPE